jgi:hypothetical protein
MSDQVGMALGEAISNIGRQIGENREWDRRRKVAQEEALKELQERMKLNKQSAIENAALSPPKERMRSVIGDDGQPMNAVDEWKIDGEKGVGSWVESRRMPVMFDKFATSREVKRGDEIITEQIQPDGTIKEIGRAPRNMTKAGGGRAPSPKTKYDKAPHPDDPKRWVSVIMKDGKADYVTNKDGELVDVAPPYRERRGSKEDGGGFLSDIAGSLDRAVTNLSTSARKYASQPQQQNSTQLSADDEATLQNARNAIASGKDPNSIRKFLSENGKGHLSEQL